MANRSLADLIRDKLGCDTQWYVNRELATGQIGTTATRIMRNDPNRVAAIVLNLSANTMYFGPFADVSTTRATARGAASGGGFSLLWDEDFDLTGFEHFGVSDGAASSILVFELVTRPSKAA